MSRLERFAVWTAAIFAVAAPVALGCGQSSSPAAAPGQVSGGSSVQSGVCPDTLQATAGAPCTSEGLMCGPQYTCEGIVAAARCTCTAGSFSCVDVTGRTLPGPDASPACPPRRDAEVCPANVVQATLALCTEPGLVCTYPTDCDATPAFRQCTCTEGPLPSGAMGLAFRCPDDCPYVGLPIIETMEGDAAAD